MMLRLRCAGQSKSVHEGICNLKLFLEDAETMDLIRKGHLASPIY